MTGDTLNQPTQDSLREGLFGSRASSELDGMSDEKLVEIANSWIDECKTSHNEIEKKQKENEKYYLGCQLDEKTFKDNNPYTANIKENRVFTSLETIIPNATAETPAPVCTIPLGNEEEDAKTADYRQQSQSIEEMLIAIAQDNKMSWKSKNFLRNQQLYYIGAWKFGVEEEGGLKRIWVENIRPQKLLIPPYPNPPYIGEYHCETIDTIKEEFYEKDKKGKYQLPDDFKTLIKNKKGGTYVGYWEFTTKDYKFWKLDNVILKKEKNPHYDFENVKNNVWCEPKVDYIFSDIWTLEKSKYSQTTLVEQTRSLQDNLNKRKRQITRSADTANGVLIGYETQGITKEEQAKIQQARREPDGVVFLEKATPGAMQEFGGKQLQPFVMDDLFDTRNAIDNIFGTHAVLRGERTPGEKTLGEASLLKEGDRTRIGELVEMLEVAYEDLYNAFAQLIRVHFTGKEYISYLQKDGTDKYIKIDKKIIKEGVRIRVRPGSTLIRDKAVMAQEALVLWQNKALDPVSLYELLGFPNPYKMAERYITWSTAPQELLPDVYKKLEERVQSDRERDVRDSVVQAGIENEALAAGEVVPPFQGVTNAHLDVHSSLMQELAQSGQFDERMLNNLRQHVEEEQKILQKKIRSKQEGSDITT